MSDTFGFLNSVLREIAISAAMGAAYEKWGDKFARKEVREIWNDVRAPLRKARDRRVTGAEIMAMTDDQLVFLGFHRWDETGLRLIPLWAFNYVADGQIMRCVNGADFVKGYDDIDLDCRGGCIAYGFLP